MLLFYEICRLSERGYNQALELARPIAKKLEIFIDNLSVVRTKGTLAQTLLSPKKREQNVKHAFSIVRAVNYKHAAIIDDVITTGATINELSKILYKNGVEKIDVWCCAKTD